MMQSEVRETREKAIELLNSLEIDRMSVEDLKFLAKSSGEVYTDKNIQSDCSNTIAKFVTEYPVEDYMGEIEDAFKTMSPNARATYLSFLTGLATENSLELFKKLVYEYQNKINDFIIRIAPTNEEAAKILFPEIIDFSSILNLGFSINSYILDCLNYGTLSPVLIKERLPQQIRTYKEIKDLFEGHFLIENKTIDQRIRFIETRDLFLSALEMLTYVTEVEEVKEIIIEETTSKDYEVRLMAVETALIYGINFDTEQIEKLAKEDSTRSKIYGFLEANEMLDLFPEEEKTQEKLARSEMVVSLNYADQLGESPKEIELWKKMRYFDEEAGSVVYYLFKFKGNTDIYGEDWMIGLTGYYYDSYLSSTPFEMTCTTYTYLTELEPQQHFDELRESILRKKWF